jgi:nitrate reductase alpha subunit
MGWLPSAPQFEENPLEITKKAAAAKMEVEYRQVVDILKSRVTNKSTLPSAPSRHLTSDGLKK